MKIIFTGPEHHQYNPKNGKTNEYNNVYLTIRDLGHEVMFFPYDRILEVGREALNRELLKTAREERPDLIFAFVYTDELLPATLAALRAIAPTVAWFSDDSWRFWNYAAELAPQFSWAVTTYPWRVQDYQSVGQKNVIVSQWGVNTTLYHPIHEPISGGAPEVSFVGAWSAPRAAIIARVWQAGIPVSVYGNGWPDTKRVSDQEMLAIFSQSAINLTLNPAPGLWNKNSLGRIIARRSMDRYVPDFHLVRNARAFLDRRIPQIKARHFEVPACGGFTIAGWADGLEQYYEPDREMVFYRTTDELIEKVRYYREQKDERERIAHAGYERTVREHTYAHRLRDIFRTMNLAR